METIPERERGGGEGNNASYTQVIRLGREKGRYCTVLYCTVTSIGTNSTAVLRINRCLLSTPYLDSLIKKRIKVLLVLYLYLPTVRRLRSIICTHALRPGERDDPITCDCPIPWVRVCCSCSLPFRRFSRSRQRIRDDHDHDRDHDHDHELLLLWYHKY
jgi:hypothetical protein